MKRFHLATKTTALGSGKDNKMSSTKCRLSSLLTLLLLLTLEVLLQCHSLNFRYNAQTATLTLWEWPYFSFWLLVLCNVPYYNLNPGLGIGEELTLFVDQIRQNVCPLWPTDWTAWSWYLCIYIPAFDLRWHPPALAAETVWWCPYLISSYFVLEKTTCNFF